MIYVKPGGREAVQEILHEVLGEGVRVVHDPDGAPLLVGSDLHISISHSRHFAAVMLSEGGRCGVDIEEPRMEQLARVKSKFLTAEELAAGMDLLTAWTSKEAAFKAAGTPGLGLSQIDTLTSPGLALLPDGRQFILTTFRTEEYTLTSAT